VGRVALVQPLQKVLIRGFAEEGWPSGGLVYNAEHDLYRFADGQFAFSLGSTPTSERRHTRPPALMVRQLGLGTRDYADSGTSA